MSISNNASAISLKPNEDVHKILVSISANFVGQYTSENTSIRLSFPTVSKSMLGMSENPYYKTHLVITFKYEHDGGMIRRDLSSFGDYFCTLLSLLYGKEFKNHGLLESHGIHRLPNFNNEFNEFFDYPQYDYKPRIDLAIPLDLGNYKLIEPFLLEEGPIDDDFRRMIIAAGKFYNRALSIFPTEPELAFLDLVTCGEIISNFNEEYYTDEQLYDEGLLKNFDRIKELEKGDRIVNDLKKRLYQVKRKFVYSLKSLLNDNFFNESEILNQSSHGQLTKENFDKSLKSTYDLRSQYVHLGLEFGSFVTPNRNEHNEKVTGYYGGLGKETDRIIENSLTFLGLERVIRFSLLSLLQKNGLEISDLLN